LSLGLKCSLVIVQAVRENVLAGIDAADMYINDGGAILLPWEHHMKLLNTILWHLQDNDSPSTHLNANGLSRKWIDLVIGSPYVVSNAGKRIM
jgi:hypothetical protein